MWHQRKTLVTRSRSHINIEKQINIYIHRIDLKKKESYKLIKNKYRPSKVRIEYDQILQFDISLEKLHDKRGDSLVDQHNHTPLSSRTLEPNVSRSRRNFPKLS